MYNHILFMPLIDGDDFFREPNDAVNKAIYNLECNEVKEAGYMLELVVSYLEEVENKKHWKAARSELNCFLNWCLFIEGIQIDKVKRREIRQYADFCRNPPQDLIGTAQRAMFVDDKETGLRTPNDEWRPFVSRIKKDLTGNVYQPPYSLSDVSLKNKISILSSFFDYLIDIEYQEHNSAAGYLRTLGRKVSAASNDSDLMDIKAFTKLETQYLIETSNLLSVPLPEDDQKEDEFLNRRMAFEIRFMLSLYPRISEVSARVGSSPVMGQISKDIHGKGWYFRISKSKHCRSRAVSISDQTLEFIKEYRTYLGLPSLPTDQEMTPLLPRKVAAKHGRESGVKFACIGEKQLWEDLKFVFKITAERLKNDGYLAESQRMINAHPHMMRHTGISIDINVNNRPIEQVREDCGHSSIDTTSKYIWTEKGQRYLTKKDAVL